MTDFGQYIEELKKIIPVKANPGDENYFIYLHGIPNEEDWTDRQMAVFEAFGAQRVFFIKFDKKCPKGYYLNKKLKICLKKPFIPQILTKEKQKENEKKFLDILTSRNYIYERTEEFGEKDRRSFFDEGRVIYYDVLNEGRGVFVEIGMIASLWGLEEEELFLFFRDELPIDKIEDIVDYYHQNDKLPAGAKRFLKSYVVDITHTPHGIEETTTDLEHKEGKDTYISKFLNKIKSLKIKW